jgi:hypothetical protein
MLYYNFAGLNVKINGMDNAKYLREHLIDYEIDSFDNADIYINHCEPKLIKKPICKVLVNKNLRSFIETDDGYGIYDDLPNSNDLMSLVIADKGWTNIDTALLDTVNIGGSSNDLRCFNMLGDIIKYAILMHNGMIIHASAISYNGYGIAFSAPSGTGKSTHTTLWKQIYKEKVTIINDDSPAIRFINGKAIVYGLPWSGSSSINTNINTSLKAIICIERGKKNEISPLDSKNTIFRILNETTKPFYPKMMNILIKRVDQLINSTQFYKLSCTVSATAVDVAKNGIFTNEGDDHNNE